MALRPTVFDRHVPPLDIASVAQAMAERGGELRVRAGRPTIEEPDHRHRRLLRARRERPRGHRAAEQRDELAPFPLTGMHPILTGREHIAGYRVAAEQSAG